MTIHLETEIHKLRKMLLSLATLTEDQVEQAASALASRDTGVAEDVIGRDADVDQMEVDIEEECLKILALYQPVAFDLRYVIAVLKINDNLEQIGDYAVNIAERVLFLSQQPDFKLPIDISAMVEKTRAMLRESLDAAVDKNCPLARNVIESDIEVDQIHRENFANVQQAIKDNPQRVESYVQLLSISRYIERIADLATNIAEDVVYMVEGKIVRHRTGMIYPN